MTPVSPIACSGPIAEHTAQDTTSPHTCFQWPRTAREQRLLGVVCRQYTSFLKRSLTMQDFHTRRSDSAATGAADTPKTPGTADGPDAARLDTLHQRVNAMLDQPLPKEGDAFP